MGGASATPSSFRQQGAWQAAVRARVVSRVRLLGNHDGSREAEVGLDVDANMRVRAGLC